MALQFLQLSSVLFLLLLLHFAIFTTSSIPLGSKLYASNLDESWISPDSIFSLSFTPSASSPNFFVAAITFAGRIPIWSTSAVDSGGSFRLLQSGSLRLVNGSNATVWDSGTDRLGVTAAALEDSGSLLLLNNKNVTLWSSFEHPTDTLVPSQNFTIGKVLRSGPYSFQIQENGNLNLKWMKNIVYWNQELDSSSINGSSLSSPSLVLKPNGILSVLDSTLPGDAIVVYSSDYGERTNNIFRFLKLDDDGNLRIYSFMRDSETTTPRWAAVSDQCQVFGYCGDLGICSYKDSSPVCGCPSENFEPVDVNDGRKGCKRRMELEDCPGNETMLSLDHTRLLTFQPELSSQLFIIDVLACRFNCLAGGSCIASVLMVDGSGVCFIKPNGFISGYQNPSFLSTSFVKVCKPILPFSPVVDEKGSKDSNFHIWVVAVVVIATLLGLVAFEVGLWWWCCRNSSKFGALSAQYTLLEYASGAPVQFSYKELQRCTKGFKEKLGAGGFGAVCRGLLLNRTVVAVKQLEGIEQGEKQFRMEVATISSTHHLNLVRLIGFCSEGRHRLLVYEFLKNGSLDSLLFASESSSSGKLLTWENRYNIALGTAKGITYLHEECRDCIVHCDIKPENILLDDNYNAKVSDFGLAKLMNPKDTRYRTSSVRGTRGYLAPEWVANLPITSKSDVYSYGMVLLEIVSGKRNFEVSDETNRKKFSLWAYDEFEKGNIEAIIDKTLSSDQTVDMEQAKRVMAVGFWCIQEHPSYRPTMGKVVQMLEGITEISKPPAPKVMFEGSVSGNSINNGSYISNLSTFAGSAPIPSSSSSQTVELSSSTSRRNVDGTSSLLKSEPK